MRISEFSVHRPVFALVISLMMVVVGVVAMVRLWNTVREFPDINPPIVSVETNYLGASAEIVETRITQPLEERIAGLEGIRTIRSASLEGRSNIVIEFEIGRDIDAAANDVRDRVSRVLDNLPDEADPPEVIKADASAEPVIFINVASDKLSVLQLTDWFERNLADRFSAVPGVARLQYAGERRFAMRIWIDNQALAARRLTVADIESALRRENVQRPAGRIESEMREFVLNTSTGFVTEQDFRELVVGRGPDGTLVRLGDVAQVILASENERTVARTNGIPGISVGLEPQSTANALAVAAAVRAEVATLQDELPEGTLLGVNIDRGVFIEASMREVIIALGISVGLVLLVMFAFLGSWRATIIPAVTIPISILGTAFAIYAMGFTINVLTLLGVVLAIGLVVDDAIVVLENIYRRIERGEKSLLAAIDGSREIGFAVIATTLVLVAVFVPISFLSGRTGRLFAEFGFTLAASILFSCLVALTLTPMMASQLFRSGTRRSRVTEAVDETFGRLSAWYRGALTRAMRAPGAVAGIAVILFVGAIGSLLALPQESTPDEDRGMIRIGLTGPEGASLQFMETYARQLEAILEEESKSGDIRRFNVRMPGGGGGPISAVNRVQGFMVLEDWGKRKRTAAEIADSVRPKVRALTGVRANLIVPSAFNWGGESPVRVVLMGPDYRTLAEWRNKVLARAAENPGLVNPDSDYKETKPHMDISIDRNRAADLGVSLDTIGRTLETTLASRVVTTFLRDGREYDVVIQGRGEDRASPADLESIYVRGQNGELVPLASLVQIGEQATAAQLNRFDRLRSITISSGLAPGYTIGEAVEFFRQVKREALPASARMAFDGETREYLESSAALYWAFFGALLVVFLILAAQFESFTLPFVILTTVPLAIIGAVAGMWLHGVSVNIFSQIAIVVLVGLAAKNGVLMVEFANQLRDQGLEYRQAIIEASIVRLRPVLMTSLCSGVGALPLVLASGPGAESREPVGVVILWGVSLSLVLTLFVVPAVYTLMAKRTRSPHYWSSVIERLRGRLAVPEPPGPARPAGSVGEADSPPPQKAG